MYYAIQVLQIILKIIDPDNKDNCYFLKSYIGQSVPMQRSYLFSETLMLQIMSLLGISTVSEVFVHPEGNFIITSGIKNIDARSGVHEHVPRIPLNKLFNNTGRSLCTLFLLGFVDMIYFCHNILTTNNAFVVNNGDKKQKIVCFDSMELKPSYQSGDVNDLIRLLDKLQEEKDLNVIHDLQKSTKVAIMENLTKAAFFFKYNSDEIQSKLKLLDKYSEHGEKYKPSVRFAERFEAFINSPEFLTYMNEHPYEIKDITKHYKTRMEYFKKETPLFKMYADDPNRKFCEPYYNASESIVKQPKILSLMDYDGINPYIE